ncbi:penicillin-binding transpeptidase domain-containing protein, partial [Kamptonema cortianum]|nr:penicillin-binding transpeptidase domain-containing protein [Kamptonema cortianum]
MPFAREINRLLLGVIVLFTVVVVAAYYWGVAGSASILSRPDNPRLVEARANTLRGGIYDASGVLLAETETGIRDSSGALARTYHEPSMFSALGYHNFRYGEGGIESAYNALLNGTARASSVSERLTNALLHRPQIGNDIQVTLDLRIQAAVYEALRGQRGAAVVIDVPTGRILALISLPDYDPNLLDTDWETLIADPGNPFFNRALVGAYQPGSAFQTPLMSAALLTEQT